ncbi:MAG: DegV family protein [Candidatus Saccharimonadales bacterium]
MSFRIVTDSSCDLTQQELFKLGIRCFPIGLTVGSKNFPDETGYFPDVDEFYKIQAKASSNSTGSMGTAPIIEQFTSVLEHGHDVLYIGIDYELSEGVMNSLIAAKEILQKQFPERRIEIPETHSIAVGLGLLLARMADFCASDVTLDEALAELDRLSKITAHWFTVSNYDQLGKSGRVKTGTRLIATALNIKPYMVLPYHGTLTVYEKHRGDGKILKRFMEEVVDTIERADRRIWIAYGSSSELARAKVLAEMIEREIAERNAPAVNISYHRIGPIIGAHVGPTVLAVFFFADKRA